MVNIYTKYDCHDKVYFLHNDEVKCGEVVRVKVLRYDDNSTIRENVVYDVEVTDTSSGVFYDREEEALYSTEEDALEYVTINMDVWF